MYDVLHDGDYRRCWDENMVDCYEICQLDRCNDIGYYSSKLTFITLNQLWCNVPLTRGNIGAVFAAMTLTTSTVSKKQ